MTDTEYVTSEEMKRHLREVCKAADDSIGTHFKSLDMKIDSHIRQVAEYLNESNRRIEILENKAQNTEKTFIKMDGTLERLADKIETLKAAKSADVDGLRWFIMAAIAFTGGFVGIVQLVIRSSS